MEPVDATLTGNAFSGRLNPNFKDNVRSLMINPFLKLGGFELFGTYELSQGKNAVENGEVKYAAVANDSTTFTKLNDRQFSQYAVDILYRIGKREQIFVAARYNKVEGTQVFGQTTNALLAGGIKQGTRVDISVERIAVAAGWFITRNILVKGEYVIQSYFKYPTANIFTGGKFNGFVLQGSIAF